MSEEIGCSQRCAYLNCGVTYYYTRVKRLRRSTEHAGLGQQRAEWEDCGVNLRKTTPHVYLKVMPVVEQMKGESVERPGLPG